MESGDRKPIQPTGPEPQELNTRILRPLLLCIGDEHGDVGLQRVYDRAGVTAEQVHAKVGWISHETFERVLAACREMLASNTAFSNGCVYDLRRGYGALLFAFSLLSGKQAFEALARTMPMVSKISRYEVSVLSSREIVMRYYTQRAESRLMCASRKAQLPTVPTFVGLPKARLQEETCVSWGDECCTYRLRLYSYARWRRPLAGVVVGLAASPLLVALGSVGPVTYAAAPVFGLLTGGFVEFLRRYRAQQRLILETEAEQHAAPTLTDGTPSSSASMPETSIDRDAPTQTTPGTPSSSPRMPLGEDLGLEPGDRIGRYELVSRAGRGGMGTVFAAKDTKLGRAVALKLLHTRRQSDALVARLVREGQALAALAHPNVVTVFDVGEWGDAVFLAMELVDGCTLKVWQQRHAEAGFEARLEILLQAAEGLAAAHDAGLIHRDFKPSNVLVGSDGRVRVVDFGLARRTDRATDGPLGDTDEATSTTDSTPSRVTQTGLVAGTPQYMAPEQVEGRKLDPRCDQFAFCVVAYEVLAGVSPFPADEDGHIYRAVKEKRRTPPRNELPAGVITALVRGLEPTRQRRLPSMRTLIAALRSVDPPGPRRRRLRR